MIDSKTPQKADLSIFTARLADCLLFRISWLTDLDLGLVGLVGEVFAISLFLFPLLTIVVFGLISIIVRSSDEGFAVLLAITC